MRGFAQGFLGGFGLNLFILVMGFAISDFPFLLFFTIPIEFFVGLLLLFFERHRPLGGGLLVASGVSLLTAGFVCSTISFG